MVDAMAIGDPLLREDRRRLPVRYDVAFAAPGVTHAIYNTDLEDLIFIVVASPPDDAQEPPR
jgi:hypothetical protein